MAYNRLPLRDPRTIAREIPGVCDILFPQLTTGTVLFFNKGMKAFDGISAIPDELVKTSTLQHAMLFEVAYARGEQILEGTKNADWSTCLKLAIERQKRHFDAVLPAKFTASDIEVADWVGKNMANMLRKMESDLAEDSLIHSPKIPGYQWIASGNGDFALGKKIIEVKCSSRNFGSADYRQILMYWLLSYASSLESNSIEWQTGILLNPRLNHIVEVSFDELVATTAAQKSKIEILELFSSIVGDYAQKILPEFRL
jgi:hypothetical protein